MPAAPFVPVPDRAAAEALGAALRRVGYDDEGLFRLLGDDAYDREPEEAPVHEQRLPDTRLANTIRLLFLERPVARAHAERALGERGVDALAATGMAELGDYVVPRGRIAPVADLLIASDGFTQAEEDPADYVATYTPTTRLCDLLTPRPRVSRALDVGTGPGAHALLASRHAGHVVATDVNPRALAFTALNAALNGIDNLECRRGSLFEPVAGERFGLITCNAPFVVSPERRWAYRDAGFEADGLSARVVRGAAEHLAPGGLATLLVSWVAEDEDDTNAHAVEWASETGCDAWILAIYGADPVDHAASWNSHLTGNRDAFAAALEEWTAYLERIGSRWVTEGAVLLHRRDGSRTRVRVDVVDDDDIEPSGPQIRQAFAARARLSELPRIADLLQQRLAPVRRLRIDRELEPRGGEAVLVTTRLRLSEGTQPVVETTAEAADVIAALDGRRTLARATATVARRHKLTQDEAAQLERRSLRLARDLLELGALQFA